MACIITVLTCTHACSTYQRYCPHSAVSDKFLNKKINSQRRLHPGQVPVQALIITQASQSEHLILQIFGTKYKSIFHILNGCTDHFPSDKPRHFPSKQIKISFLVKTQSLLSVHENKAALAKEHFQVPSAW